MRIQLPPLSINRPSVRASRIWQPSQQSRGRSNKQRGNQP